ncbi:MULTISPECIES: helix-turn-helix domain-containing protein [Haloferax]|uniref:Helix-turn-helix domain-containing protein n=2 Tax=Haloferax TaxID=2251 RepID=A0A1H7L9G7_HALLR|nr:MULTISPECIES: helix-turn-helix domain-containing protein [Haloferax]ELZ76340.1 ArsR family transcriptional regulator [Haloferax larsenii JCM 13917]ELZ87290.1 ArsR family transcriptional regulator [Haloferax elongans ATCC BAA-1513]UVE51329.1 helix-turn-helix domain-containing protein [Haloferax larsenii]SEK95135.1 IclR helix-turn-helix domain-containing protein [Haloferax larsenii]
MLVVDNGTTVAEQELFALMSAPAVPDLLRVADEPLTVKELSNRADVPLSTAYREVNRLHEVSLLEKSIVVNHTDGRHVSQYCRTFESMEVTVTDDGLRVELDE